MTIQTEIDELSKKIIDLIEDSGKPGPIVLFSLLHAYVAACLKQRYFPEQMQELCLAFIHDHFPD